MKRIFGNRASLVGVLALTLMFAAGCHSATVAAHPINNTVFYTVDDSLHKCDQSLTDCLEVKKLGFEPVDATFTDSGLVFLAGRNIYRCDKDGNNCSQGIPIKLTDEPVSLYGRTGGEVVVVSKSGNLNSCDATSCNRPAAPKE